MKREQRLESLLACDAVHEKKRERDARGLTAKSVPNGSHEREPPWPAQGDLTVALPANDSGSRKAILRTEQGSQKSALKPFPYKLLFPCCCLQPSYSSRLRTMFRFIFVMRFDYTCR